VLKIFVRCLIINNSKWAPLTYYRFSKHNNDASAWVEPSEESTVPPLTHFRMTDHGVYQVRRFTSHILFSTSLPVIQYESKVCSTRKKYIYPANFRNNFVGHFSTPFEFTASVRNVINSWNQHEWSPSISARRPLNAINLFLLCRMQFFTDFRPYYT
jgi:hypothetical protein